MRCVITYTWNETSFSGGAVDFGITGPDDAKIAKELDALTNRGMYIVSVRIY